MIDKDKPHDEADEKELAGVPEELLDRNEDGEGEGGLDTGLEDAIASLRGDLDAAQQDMLYAKAEVQNVRRRMEKDIADARAYAATGFARDILSVADNLGRAIEAIPAELHEDPISPVPFGFGVLMFDPAPRFRALKVTFNKDTATAFFKVKTFQSGREDVDPTSAYTLLSRALVVADQANLSGD